MSDPRHTPEAPPSRRAHDVAARWGRWQAFQMVQHTLPPEAAARGSVVVGALARLKTGLVARRPPATHTEPPAAPDAGHVTEFGVNTSDERGR